MSRVALILALLCAGGTAVATEFGARFPVGSLADREQANTALQAVDIEQARIEREYQERAAGCHRRFFVNRCLDAARSDREAAEREVRRVRLEARDLQRRLDAEELARRRAADQARPPVEKSPPAAAEPRAPTEPRPLTRQPETQDSTRTPAEEAKSLQQRANAEAQRQERIDQAKQRATEDAEHVRRADERQAEIERRAQAKDAERLKTEQRRAERQAKLKAQEAQREEIRRRAGAAASGLGK